MDVLPSGGRLESLRRDVSARKCPGAQPLRPPLTLALLRKVAQQEGATCYHVVEHAGILENQGLIQDQLKEDLADSLTEHLLLKSNGE